MSENNSVIRQDFMSSSSGKKGTAKDPLTRQTQRDSKTLSNKEIENIYKHNRIAQNIIDIPAEDATREGWAIEIEEDNKSKDYQEIVLNKLEDLDDKKSFKQLMKYERKTGDGYIALGISQMGSYNLNEKLEMDKIRSLDYLNPFSHKYINDAVIDEDPFSENFRDVGLYEVNLDGKTPVEVDSSRLLHMQTRSIEGYIQGIPIFTPMYDALTILDSTAWSLGQLIYSATFKVIKSPNIDVTNFDKWVQASEKYDFEFNTLTTALLGKDDEMEFKGGGGKIPDIGAIVDFMWDYIAGCARMPKSHLLGQQQGTITGGQFDSLNYYMRIAGIQENFIRPELEKIIEIIIKSEENEIPNDANFSLTFNPLWRLDKETDVDIRKKQAEIDKIYIEKGVESPDDVSEKRFNNNPIADALDLSEGELKELAELDNELAGRMNTDG